MRVMVAQFVAFLPVFEQAARLSRWQTYLHYGFAVQTAWFARVGLNKVCHSPLQIILATEHILPHLFPLVTSAPSLSLYASLHLTFRNSHVTKLIHRASGSKPASMGKISLACC
jgi:hypothetical protein